MMPTTSHMANDMPNHMPNHMPNDGAVQGDDILLASTPNLRDLGGLVAADGRRLARARLFRSSHFGGLDESDAILLRRLSLRTRIDLRGVDERAATPGALTGVDDIHLPIEPRALGVLRERRQAGETIDPALMLQVMNEVYRRFVHERAPVFAALLQHLLEAPRYPIVFHCTAGKDRTGFAAALVLLALGASRGAIIEDFLLSNGRWRSPHASQDMAMLSLVRREYLQTAFDAMDEGWGGAEAYLDRALGFGEEQRRALRFLLLEP